MFVTSLFMSCVFAESGLYQEDKVIASTCGCLTAPVSVSMCVHTCMRACMHACVYLRALMPV